MDIRNPNEPFSCHRFGRKYLLLLTEVPVNTSYSHFQLRVRSSSWTRTLLSSCEFGHIGVCLFAQPLPMPAWHDSNNRLLISPPSRVWPQSHSGVFRFGRLDIVSNPGITPADQVVLSELLDPSSYCLILPVDSRNPCCSSLILPFSLDHNHPPPHRRRHAMMQKPRTT